MDVHETNCISGQSVSWLHFERDLPHLQHKCHTFDYTIQSQFLYQKAVEFLGMGKSVITMAVISEAWCLVF